MILWKGAWTKPFPGSFPTTVFMILCSARNRYKRSRKGRSNKSPETLSGLCVNPLWWTSVINRRIRPRGSDCIHHTNSVQIILNHRQWFVFLKHLLNWRNSSDSSTRRRFSPSKYFQLLYLATGLEDREETLISIRYILWHNQLPAEVWVQTIAQLHVDQMRANSAMSSNHDLSQT